MLILITISILLVAAASITLLRVVRPAFGYTWLLASVGTFLAWISVLFWQLRMPFEITPTLWQPTALFAYSPSLLADGFSWPFALALATMCLAAILTAPLRMLPVNPLTMAGTLTLTAIGLVAVTARNPLTLLIAWGALDLAELSIVLRTFETERQSESAVVAFAVRSVGLGLLIWANVSSMALGLPLDFNLVSPQAEAILIIAVGLRLGVLPLHLPYADAPVLRRGFGTVVRLVSAAASLVVLARIPNSAVASNLAPWFLLFTLAAALYGGWKWFRAEDELVGRPYWIIGMGALALAAALGGNPVGSAALGTALILFGSLAFLYSHGLRVLTVVILVTLLALPALPYTLTAPSWDPAGQSYPWIWSLLIVAHSLLIAGLARFVVMGNKLAFDEQQRWQKIVYSAAMGALIVVVLALGLWGWAGARQIGAWWVGTVITALAIGLTLLRLRLKFPAGGKGEPQLVRRRPLFSAGAWSLYYTVRQVSELIASTFEGDGGILWTLLLLVLFITLVQGIR